MNWLTLFMVEKLLVDDIDILIDKNNIKYQIVKIDGEELIISANGVWELLISDDCKIIDNVIISDDWESPNEYKIKFN